MAGHKPYLIINLILAGIIGMIFLYSGLFSAQKDNHPVPSFFEEITGQPSPSSGMSRAFSEIMRGDLQSARNYNEDSLLIFTFFLVQFLQRLSVSYLLLRWKGSHQSENRRTEGRKKKLLLADILSSVILFLVCFAGQISALFRILFS
jgi:hypothetical protein